MKNHLSLLNILYLLLLLVSGFGCAPMADLSLTAESNPYQEDELLNEEEAQESIVEAEEVMNEELADFEKSTSLQGSSTSIEGESQLERHEKKVHYDFPITYNKKVEFYLSLFQNRQRPYVERWLSRSTKYLPLIRQELKKAGLPQDLAYLAMIESGFNPSAYSKAHAAGLWQFIPGTGKHFDLRVDSWVDERRNPVKATPAAIEYLSFLYKEFGDWYLAAAAYNAGEGKIARAIDRYNTRDFWKLTEYNYLKLETKRYVPKLIAAIIIAKNPEKYGFTNIEYQKPSQYDTTTVPALTSLEAIAISCHSDTKTLKKLNNELTKNMTPPGIEDYNIRIPPGARELVNANLPRVHPVVSTDFKTHEVRKGDTISSICRAYKLNKTTLLKANDLRSAALQPGKRLRIPFQTTKYVLLEKGVSPQHHFASAESGGRLLLHSIKPGETLSRIAKQYQVSPEIIMQWNGLNSVHKIRAGQQLALYLDNKTMTAAPMEKMAQASSSRNSTPVLTPTSKKMPARRQERETEPAITYYRVKDGDSLWDIAKKFKVSTLQLKKWNNLRSNTIQPGNRLIVKEG